MPAPPAVVRANSNRPLRGLRSWCTVVLVAAIVHVATFVSYAAAMRLKDACPATKGYGFATTPHPGTVAVTTIAGNANPGLVDAVAPGTADQAEFKTPRFVLFHAETGALNTIVLIVVMKSVNADGFLRVVHEHYTLC